MGNESVPLNYVPILIFAVTVLGFGVVSLLLGGALRPDRPYRAKLKPYESGSPLFSDARVPFPMRYYIIAMLFVIFDVETIFFYPWAVAFRDLGIAALIGMLFFIGILFIGFWYEWQKGALEWD